MKQESGKIAIDLPDATKYEVYDYPGEYLEPGEAKDDARIRQEELPKALASGSEILSGWDKDTVFFADPYFGRTL